MERIYCLIFTKSKRKTLYFNKRISQIFCPFFLLFRTFPLLFSGTSCDNTIYNFNFSQLITLLNHFMCFSTGIMEFFNIIQNEVFMFALCLQFHFLLRKSVLLLCCHLFVHTHALIICYKIISSIRNIHFGSINWCEHFGGSILTQFFSKPHTSKPINTNLNVLFKLLSITLSTEWSLYKRDMLHEG